MDEATLDHAVRLLRKGQLVAFPTETVYGLGADARNDRAVAAIYEKKRRPSQHPLIVHLSDGGKLTDWAHSSPMAERLAQRFWPGPLTLVLSKREDVSRVVTGGRETIGLRVPKHPVALGLLRRFGGAIAAPSANRFGSVSPTHREHVLAEFGSEAPLVLEGGSCEVGLESTIVGLAEGTPQLLRPGGISREALEAELGCALSVPQDGVVRAPGSHPVHYSPNAEVRLVPPERLHAECVRLATKPISVGVLLPMPGGRGGAELNIETVATFAGVVLGGVRSPEDYARQLYDNLRAFDRHGCQVVLTTLPEPIGIGLAVADRLTRAAAKG